jgi:hypothetical protein
MFWGNAAQSPVIFKMQERVIGILMEIGYRESCRGLFKDLKILPFSLQYILSLLLFVVLNRCYFAPNSVSHNFNTRQRNNLHLSHVSLTMYQRGVFYSGIGVFNALPSPVKDISGNPKKFKVVLKHILLTHSFYNLDKFFSEQNALTYVMLDANYNVQILIFITLISIVIYLLFYNYYSS